MFKLIEADSSEENIYNYEVKLEKGCTVESFINTVLENSKSSWGYIGIVNENKIDFLSKNFGSPRCSYRYGVIVSGSFPAEILDSRVVKATARKCGKSDMDFKLWIEED